MTSEIRQGWLTTADGTRLATYSAGPGDAPALLLANGIAGSVSAWRHLVSRFSDRFRIVSWDYRGLYRSFAPPSHDFSVARQCDDLEAVLADQGVDRCVVVAWFMGAQVALEACRRRPDRFLAMAMINGTAGRLYSTGFTADWVRRAAPRVVSTFRRAGPLLEIAGPPLLANGIFVAAARSAGFVSPTLDEPVALGMMRDFVRLDLDALSLTFQALDAHDARDVLPRVKVPTLIVTGDRDLVTPMQTAREMADRIPGAELLVVKGGSHYVPLEYPAVINLRLEKFLRERLPDLLVPRVRSRKTSTSTRRPDAPRPLRS